MKRLSLAIIFACFALIVAAQEVTENRGFKALLNGKIAVEVFFQTAYYNGEWQTAGYIYYPKAKKPAPILIAENWGNEDPIVSDEDNVFDRRFVEYQPDGEMTGIIYLTYAEVEGDFQMLKGSWKNPTTGKVMSLSNFQEMRDGGQDLQKYSVHPTAMHGNSCISWKTSTTKAETTSGWTTSM